MTLTQFRKKTLLLMLAVTLVACSSKPQVTRTQEVSDSVKAPFEKILVITLFSAFDSRRYLEDETVKRLAELGTESVASTSMMNTKTPVTQSTFIAMVDEIGADAVLLTQLASLESTKKVVTMRPRQTVNYWPTYYYNVFAVEVTEYVEPPSLEVDYDLSLVTELISVESREQVWAIESKSRIVQDHEQVADYSVFVDEADAIAGALERDGLIVKQ